MWPQNETAFNIRHLSIVASWHLNYDKIAVKGGVGLIKVVNVQKIQIVT